MRTLPGRPLWVGEDGEVPHFDHDLLIIGSGSGNSIPDERFADLDTAIVDAGIFGGTCLNTGCLPTKMFVHPADLQRDAEDGPRLGVGTRPGPADWPAIRDRVFGRIDAISAGGLAYRRTLPRTTVYDEHATFVDDHTLRIGQRQVTADQIVLAAGSRAVLPPIEGLDEVTVHTSDTIMRLPELPASMAIIGGGYVAAEFAHVFSAYGTKVTQVARSERLLQHQDAAVSQRFTELAGRRWEVRQRTSATRVRPSGTGVELTLTDGSTLRVDTLLVATGRVPNSDILGLEHTGVKLTETGVVRTDEHQRTSVPHIWALGDVANDFQLKHLANHEARVVQHNLLHRDDPDAMWTSDHSAVPAVVFTYPQIATVGATEEALAAAGTSYEVGVRDFGGVGYGWALEDTEHFAKVLAEPGRGRILGAHIIGPQASLLLQPLVQGMALGSTAEEVARGQLWPHPALSEVVENALLALGG